MYYKRKTFISKAYKFDYDYINKHYVGVFMNKDMLSFLKGVLTVAVLLLLSTPLILMNVFQGELPGPWIGFWGSFSGGILGTAGVIYIAYLQNQSQIDRMNEAEKHNRERLRIQTQLEFLEKYREDVERLRLDVDLFYLDSNKMISSFIILNNLFKEKNAEDRSDDLKQLETEVNVKWENIKKINRSHFLKSFRSITHQKIVLSSIEIKVGEIPADILDAFESLDEAAKFLDHYNLHLDAFITTRTDKKSDYDYVVKGYDKADKWLGDEEIIIHDNISRLINRLDKYEKRA